MGQAPYWLLAFVAVALSIEPTAAEGIGPGDWPAPSVSGGVQPNDAKMEALERSMRYLAAHRCDPNPFTPDTVEKHLVSIECRLKRIEDKLDRIEVQSGN